MDQKAQNPAATHPGNTGEGGLQTYAGDGLGGWGAGLPPDEFTADLGFTPFLSAYDKTPTDYAGGDDLNPLVISGNLLLGGGNTIIGDEAYGSNAAPDAEPPALRSVAYGNVTYDGFHGMDAAGKYLEIETDSGTLKIYEDGPYTFTANSAYNGWGLSEIFTYGIVQGDSEPAYARLFISDSQITVDGAEHVHYTNNVSGTESIDFLVDYKLDDLQLLNQVDLVDVIVLNGELDGLSLTDLAGLGLNLYKSVDGLHQWVEVEIGERSGWSVTPELPYKFENTDIEYVRLQNTDQDMDILVAHHILQATLA
ncbi:MAG: hypothetical protein FWF99_02580 [Desulfovibrionaceae bacterium]|nr:hypothetical protein [Desulfovibrionaceae bacterium]